MTVSKRAAAAAKAPAKAPEVPRIEIQRVDIVRMLVPITGTTPLIMHNFSDKSKRQMLEAQQGKRSIKEHRDPQAEYEAAFYRIANPNGPETFGMPAVAFKAATIGGARFYGKAIKMTEIRQFVFVKGVFSKADPQSLIPVTGEPEMREDIVRLGGMSRSADLRYRPLFPEWTAVLEVHFAASSLSQDSVLSLIEAGGLGVGVGEWRPEKDGDFGTYVLDGNREVEVIG
jgi:hypothetical protein